MQVNGRARKRAGVVLNEQRLKRTGFAHVKSQKLTWGAPLDCGLTIVPIMSAAEGGATDWAPSVPVAVSYTHLTLPTIYSV